MQNLPQIDDTNVIAKDALVLLNQNNRMHLEGFEFSSISLANSRLLKAQLNKVTFMLKDS